MQTSYASIAESELVIHIDGELIPERLAGISPLDRGFLYGYGIFETMRAYGGRIHLLGRHLKRLARGAELLGIDLPLSTTLVDALIQTVDANGLGDIIIRLTVTQGIPADHPGDPTRPTIVVTPRLLVERDYESGEKLVLLRARRSQPELGTAIKSLNYLTSAYSWKEIAQAKAGEGILLSHDGWVAEGSMSNLFCVRDGTIFTPPLDLGILDGITRARVMELAGSAALDLHELRFTPRFMTTADECFYTNSAREIVPVTSIGNETIGDGRPGEITRYLMELYRSEAPSEWL